MSNRYGNLPLKKIVTHININQIQARMGGMVR